MTDAARMRDAAASGRLLTLTVDRPAAGGTFVARHEGRVVFVRGTAPGETVTARLVDDPEEKAGARFWRAETIDVLEPSADRVPSVWAEAGVDGVGPRGACRGQERVDAEVGLGRGGSGYGEGGIGELHVQGIGVLIGVDGHRGVPGLGAGADDADGDLAAIGDEDCRHVSAFVLGIRGRVR